MPDDSGVAKKLRILPDAMVLAAGLTSRREPASFSRRLVEAALDGLVELVLTETLLEEALAVLVDPDFRGRLSDDVAEVLLGALRAVAVEFIDDTALSPPTRSSDPMTIIWSTPRWRPDRCSSVATTELTSPRSPGSTPVVRGQHCGGLACLSIESSTATTSDLR